MAATEHGNGYVRLTTLVAVALPLLTLFAAAIAVYVNLSIAPLAKQIDNQETSIKDIRSELVPRSEHSRDWNAQDQHFADIQRQIDENKRDIHDMYSAHDALADLSERLRALENHEPAKPR